MKSLGIAIGVVVVALGLVAGAVFGLGDDEILVSPPDSVAQEFVRAMALGQPGAAREMLSIHARRHTGLGELQRTSTDFRARIGRLDDVDGTVARRNRDTAVVRARVEGKRADANPSFVLVREWGEWTVARATNGLEVNE